MNLSSPFIKRPIASILIGVGVALLGALAFSVLPVSSLPEVEFPTIAVTAMLPGADPETVASSVATPLEQQFSSIAGVTEMTSTSYTGSVRIVLQFDLDRDINGAARDVQAAINAARSRLPDDLDGSPTYRKVNPAEAPVLILALTSDVLGRAPMYDAATTILQQKLLQTEGVGDVMVGGGALPAVRVELDPERLDHNGISLEQVRKTLAAANVDLAKGHVDAAGLRYQIAANDSLRQASDYADLVVGQHNGAVVQLRDVGNVIDSIESLHNYGEIHGEPTVAIVISKRPGANVVATVDRIRAELPALSAMIPSTIHISVGLDRTQTIRASLHDVEITLLVAILLVIAVTAAFFRDWRATLVPAVVVPLSLLGTFGVMWAFGYSLNILSLMAMTIATGFVVDDAIVVVENIMRHLAMGKSRLLAALDGAGEIGFTVLSISVSLIAVFIPLLLMSGLVGRLFREFSVTLAAAITVSMLISLTLTPMLCKLLLRPRSDAHGRIDDNGRYARSLRWVFDHPRLMLGITLSTMALTLLLFAVVPKGFFPQQDTGLLMGRLQAPQNISFNAMRERFRDAMQTIQRDPAVVDAFGFIGGTGTNANNTGMLYATLTPRDAREASANGVIDRLRQSFADEAGAQVTLQAVQDIMVGGRQEAGQYQYTLSADNMALLDTWAPRVMDALQRLPQLTDLNSDQQDQSLRETVHIDRDQATRLGVKISDIDQTLYDAFGERRVSTIYSALNQYHVVMEVDPRFSHAPSMLDRIYVPANAGSNPGSSSTNTLVPLSAVAHHATERTAIAISHQGLFPAVTLSFNLAQGAALGQATKAIDRAVAALDLPADIITSYAGSAKAFGETAKTMPLLLLAALATVYIVLGMLYESFVHPITILSTLPSAGLGALLALLVCHFDLTVISLIGIILLIGIVKKNAIMMVDFALSHERQTGCGTREAIFRASLVRLRPITMTTLAAVLGALPLVIGGGYGSEFRRPLGATIIGGLLVSQLLTMYATPVIYLWMDRWQRSGKKTDARGATG